MEEVQVDVVVLAEAEVLEVEVLESVEVEAEADVVEEVEVEVVVVDEIVVEEIKAERAEKIIELKKQIETQMVALKQETSKDKKVTVLDEPVSFSVSAMQQEEDIEKLKSKTMSANQFNKKYGSGTAEDILANPKDY